jgi:hypothetical protein
MSMTELDRKLRAQALLEKRVEGDRLMLADDILLAALDGRRPLRAGERAALQASPLTLRRLRRLADARRAASSGWKGSSGVLRAADSGAALEALATADGLWRLHFVAVKDAWRVILQLEASASSAAQVLAAAPLLRVTDGRGDVILEGRLDADGECEGDWPFAQAPATHFQQHGAVFKVEPAREGK